MTLPIHLAGLAPGEDARVTVRQSMSAFSI